VAIGKIISPPIRYEERGYPKCIYDGFYNRLAYLCAPIISCDGEVALVLTNLSVTSMKTYKKFKIHLVNGKEEIINTYREDGAFFDVASFLKDCWPEQNTVFATRDDIAIPFHAIAMIEGVDDESKT